MLNTFTMTALMVILGISGQSHLAADIGIIQGAIAALFFSFSANARSIILNPSSRLSVDSIFQTRIILILPLALAAYFLSALPSDAATLLIVAFIVRRCVEWISEIHLSEMELLEKRVFARNFICLQTFVFLLALSWLFSGLPLPLIGLFVWALAPVLMSVRFIREKLKKPVSFHYSWRLMFPQFGSTMIIGITLYVFRLIILLITGKEIAGILFTAFALGGMVGSLFAQVLGPSVVLYENVNKKSFFSFWINALLGFTVFAGMILFICSQYASENVLIPVLLRKSYLLWGSIGASLVGGVIMVYAQLIRFRILQLYGDNNLFGPDLLMNLLIIACVPYIYYILGINALMILYLISSIFAYVFYWCSERQDIGNKQFNFASGKIFMTLIASIIILPVFFQFKSGLFNDPAMVYDSSGSLMNLPIPISVIVCYMCIPLLGRYRHAYLSLSFVFTIYIAMLVASFVTTGKQNDDMSAKLIFLLQFILPMVALVLGQLYESHKQNAILCNAFLYVIAIVVPLQLLLTWVQGTIYLSPYLYFFSIYQHLQYVPVIFVSAYLIALYGLWQLPRFRKVLLILIPVMGLYATASISISALVLFFSGIIILIIHHYYEHGIDKALVLAVMVTFLLSIGYLYLGRNVSTIAQKYNFSNSSQFDHFDSNDQYNIPNISSRIYYWNYHMQKSMSGAKEFMFGNRHRPDRNKMPSAHNYYIDLLYNFGFLSLLPIIILIGFTIVGLYRHRIRVLSSPEVLCLSYVVMFILLIDNSLKVGLRQPYSGIFTFFIWGIMLSKLNEFSRDRLTELQSTIDT